MSAVILLFTLFFTVTANPEYNLYAYESAAEMFVIQELIEFFLFPESLVPIWMKC